MATSDAITGALCSVQQDSSIQPQPFTDSYSCLTHGESIGLALVAEASLISSISVVVIFIWIGWNVRWYRKTFPKGDWKLFQRPADVYMFSLFVFDLLQGIGGVLDIRWAHRGIVVTGHYCTAQGTIQQISPFGVALINVLLAVHTFVAALWRVGLEARGVALGMVCFVCVFITVCFAIEPGIIKNHELPSRYWCLISPGSFSTSTGVYIWLWITLLVFASAILYIPLYFWAEGRFSVDEECWYKFRMSDLNQRTRYAQRRAALGMLLYPLASALVLLPLFIPQWLEFDSYNNVSSAATLFGLTMFNLSGAIDVFLFLKVRPQLLLFPRPEKLAEPDIELSPAQGTDSTMFSEHSPEPTSAAVQVEGSRNNAGQSLVSSRGISDDI